MKTISFENYSRNRIAADMVEMAEPVEGERDLGWLSSFNVPTAVEVRANTEDATFFFHYSDNEHPETKWRAVPGEYGLRILLGRHTKKILALQLPDPLSVLSNRIDFFDSRLVWLWASDFPDRTGKILSRSAQVVKRILDSMPDKIRSEIIRTLKAQQTGAR